MRLDQLKPYENNAKKHDETQIANVAKSLELYGWQQPIVIDKNNVIVIGHCRALAAQRLGWEVAPCVIASDLTDEEIKGLRIVDNKTNESVWDYPLLEAEVAEIDLSAFEFNLDIHQYEPINDEGFEPTKTQEYTLSFGNRKVYMTEDEFKRLDYRLSSYVEENGIRLRKSMSVSFSSR